MITIKLQAINDKKPLKKDLEIAVCKIIQQSLIENSLFEDASGVIKTPKLKQHRTVKNSDFNNVVIKIDIE